MSERIGQKSMSAAKRALVQEFERNCQIIERVVWAVGLTTYQEHRERWTLLLEAGCAPHDAIFKLAMHYLTRLDAGRPEHGDSIEALGDVLRFAGSLARVYQPTEADTGEKSAKETLTVH